MNILPANNFTIIDIQILSDKVSKFLQRLGFTSEDTLSDEDLTHADRMRYNDESEEWMGAKKALNNQDAIYIIRKAGVGYCAFIGGEDIFDTIKSNVITFSDFNEIKKVLPMLKKQTPTNEQRSKLKSLVQEVIQEMVRTRGSTKNRVANVVKESISRDHLKSAIKKIVLSEITKSDYGVGKVATNKEFVGKLDKALKKAQGENVSVEENPIGGKIVFDDGKNGSNFQVDVYPCDDTGNHYDVTAMFQGSERFVGKRLTQDEVLEFIEDNFTGEKPCLSYADKALKKGKAPIDPDSKKYDKNTDKAKEISKEVADDETEEAEEKKQIDIADDNDLDAEEDDVKIDDELEPQLGGALVDKIEKIIDKVLSGKKDKAEPKSAYLKADKKMESPDKLVVKTKETPKLKEKKS